MTRQYEGEVGDDRELLERHVRRLLRVDDGIVGLTRRELVARSREALGRLGASASAYLGPEIDWSTTDRQAVETYRRHEADLEAALVEIEWTSPRAPRWDAAASALRDRLGAHLEDGLAPIIERAERRFGRPWVEHVEREAQAGEATTAPLPKAA